MSSPSILSFFIPRHLGLIVALSIPSSFVLGRCSSAFSERGVQNDAARYEALGDVRGYPGVKYYRDVPAHAPISDRDFFLENDLIDCNPSMPDFTLPTYQEACRRISLDTDAPSLSAEECLAYLTDAWTIRNDEVHPDFTLLPGCED